MKDIVLKDFLYLDFERVRSFSAQLFEGITENTTHSNENQISGGGSTKLNILNTVGADVEGKLVYTKANSETKSLHHKLYLDFENEIEKLGKSFFVNSIDDLIQKDFIKVKGRLQIVDYQDISNKISLAKNIGELSLLQQKTNLNNITDRNQKAIQQQNISKNKNSFKDFESFAELISNIYGDSLKVNFFINDEIFASSFIDKELIQFKSQGLITGLEDLTNESWVTFAEIIRKDSIQNINNNQDAQNVDDIIAKLLPAFDQVKSMLKTTNAKYEILPIAIYREL